jgi:hypothetical protein
MSETQFTREDWRPSRKRASKPRLKPGGGQKKAPAAFLAAAAKSGFQSGKTPRCPHCRRFALKGVGFCRWHAGTRLSATITGSPHVRSAHTIAREAKYAAKRAEANSVNEPT